MFFRTIGIALILFLAGSAAAQVQSTGCKAYEPTVVRLEGILTPKTFPGPPNYDDVRKGDKAEHYWLLKLNSPICVDEDKSEPDLGPPQQKVETVQLVLAVEQYQKYRSLLGRRVVATGTLFGAITGHHHTPVLLRVKTIEMMKD